MRKVHLDSEVKYVDVKVCINLITRTGTCTRTHVRGRKHNEGIIETTTPCISLLSEFLFITNSIEHSLF